MRVKIMKGPLKGFQGVIEQQVTKTQVRLRIDSTVVMRVEIPEAHLRHDHDA